MRQEIGRRELGKVAAAALAIGAGSRGLAATPAAAGPRAAGSLADLYRPQVHFSPAHGFMNDPNGLIRVGDDYHLFYQFSPSSIVPGHVGWGYAVSRDLLGWQDRPMALTETVAGEAFSGSAVMDAHNSSGLFGPGQGGMVLAYTRATPSRQVQEIAYSLDGGRSFRAYAGNPVIDIGSAQFRDPKLLWHASTRRWIMVTVHARDHQVVFYASPDLRQWREVGRFGPAGLLGTDYECPDLVEVPVEGGGRRWVLFVSINPGAPLGGSAVQYFIGGFDGQRFVAEDAVARIADFGPDFYALQTFADVAQPTAIAWMSNWLYTAEVPATTWRGAMTLPRRLSLRRGFDGLRLVQTPVALDALRDRVLLGGARPAGRGVLAGTALPIGAALDLRLGIAGERGSVTTVRLVNDAGEALTVCFDAGGLPSVVMNRAGTRGFAHRFFMGQAIWAAPPGTSALDLHLVVDRCSLELWAEHGLGSGTMLHYFAEPPTRLEIVVEQASAALTHLQLTSLRPSMMRGEA